MTTTDAIHGRPEFHGADQATEVQSTLDRARKLFAGLSKVLEAEIDRLQFAERTEEGEARLKAVTDLIRQNQKTLGTVLDIEAKLMRDAERDARPGRVELDLEDARAEIARRLARLAA